MAPKTIDRTFNPAINKNDLMSFYKNANVITLNPNEFPIQGQRYKTYADIMAYLGTLPPAQQPSPTNPYLVKFNGTITENIGVYENVILCGDSPSTSILAGSVQFMNEGSAFSNMIYNTALSDLIIDNTIFAPTPVTYTIDKSTPYSPDTFLLAFTANPGVGGSYMGYFTISIVFNGTTYTTGHIRGINDTVLPGEYSSDIAGIQAAIQAMDPLFSLVTTFGTNPCGGPVSLNLDGLPSSGVTCGSVFVDTTSLSNFGYAKTEITKGNDEVQSIVLSDIPDSGTFELLMDWGGVTYSSGTLTAPFDGTTLATLQAGIRNNIISPIEVVTGYYQGSSDLTVGYIPPATITVTFTRFCGVQSSTPPLLHANSTLIKSAGSVKYSISQCTVIDVTEIGMGAQGNYSNCNILGGNTFNHTKANFTDCYINPLSKDITLGEGYLTNCILDVGSSNALFIGNNSFYACSFLQPAYLTLIAGTNFRFRNCNFDFGQLYIPATCNVKMFACFVIDTIKVHGILTTFGCTLEGGGYPCVPVDLSGGGFWDNVGDAFDPTGTTLTETDVQHAIQEIYGMISTPNVVTVKLTAIYPHFSLPKYSSVPDGTIYKIYCNTLNGYTAIVNSFYLEYIYFPEYSYKNSYSGSGLTKYIFERPGCLTIVKDADYAGWSVLSEEFDRDNYLEVKDNMFNRLSDEWVPYVTNIGTAEFLTANHGFKMTTSAAIGGSLMGYSWGDNYIKNLDFNPIMDVLIEVPDILNTEVRFGFKDFLGNLFQVMHDSSVSALYSLELHKGGSGIISFCNSPLSSGIIRLSAQVTGDSVIVKVNNEAESIILKSMSLAIPTTELCPFFEIKSKDGSPVSVIFHETRVGQELIHI